MLVAVTCAALVGLAAGSGYAQAPTERFVVTGVIFVEGGRGLAWLQEPTFTKNKVIAVHPGDRVGPYRVTKILEDQVVLEGPGGTVSVPIAGGPGTTTAAVSPGARHPKATEPPPLTASNQPAPIVIPRGDARRNFPVTEFLGGTAAPGPSAASNRGAQPGASDSRRASSSLDGSQTTPQTAMPQTGTSTMSGATGSGSGGGPTIIPRGDPRRNFPVADFFPQPTR
jgi:hypothetical protein